MQCERCNKKKATVFYRENINGRVKALRLCGDCAEVMEEAGELEDMSTVLSGAHSPLFAFTGTGCPIPLWGDAADSSKKTCPTCGESLARAAERGRLGCPACYTAFSSELAAPLRVFHGRATHTGRVSAGFRARKEAERRLSELRERLRAAVAAEEFEQAAAMRDEIRRLEATL
ncbi:MAG: UvrB/UvrC motif-containing protein [Clostridia bacterium]|nr:UvrB/UvrC motif-containing protein [Clostridia bacterium]